MFGFTEEQIAAFGMVGFVAKYMIQWLMGIT